MSAQEYVEAVARAISQVRGRGLLLSPADAALALSWHARGVPLQAVLEVVRTQGGEIANPLSSRQPARGARASLASLQALAASIDGRFRQRAHEPKAAPDSLAAELTQAAQAARLPARGAWESLAVRAEALLTGGAEAYWTHALFALRDSLRELPREARLRAGALLRERRAPRPLSMPRPRYRRSLQMLLLSASSELHGVPPREFLL